MEEKLRPLIYQMGRALSEAIEENEAVARIVGEIRQQGFETVIQLEATLGLNKIEPDEDDELTPDDYDNNFLKELKISRDTPSE